MKHLKELDVTCSAEISQFELYCASLCCADLTEEGVANEKVDVGARNSDARPLEARLERTS